jgi:hypothetical protein
MQWPEFRWLRNRPADTEPKIDMGDGRFLTAADVLEGHYRRLATQTVTLQVKPDLQAAITVVAPELAPLTAVATDVAQALPRIQPTSQFRSDLHRALELTHRQHHAQRALGTYPPAVGDPVGAGQPDCRCGRYLLCGPTCSPHTIRTDLTAQLYRRSALSNIFTTGENVT